MKRLGKRRNSNVLHMLMILLLTVFSGIGGNAICGQLMKGFVVHAETPINAGCSSVRRTSAAAATAWVYSDTAGDIYFFIDEKAESVKTADQIIETGYKSGESISTAGSVAAVSLSDATGMYKNKKYVHFS